MASIYFPRHCERSEAIEGSANRPGLLRCARNDVYWLRWLVAAFAALLLTTPALAQQSRIKDLGSFEGIRSNQLVGYGIVVGLAGTGDDSFEYLTQGMGGIAARFGITLPPGVDPGLKNAAAVLITAELPPLARPGQRIDITVSAIGRARSLRGGTLILAPLQGADGQIYAMAQGNLVIGGLGVSAADGSRLTVNIPSAGRIPAGATVERAVRSDFGTAPALLFNLAEADATTAQLVADAINREMGEPVAVAMDAVSVRIEAGIGDAERAALMSRIENIPLTPAQTAARVIVNSRTGTIVINGAVTIGAAAISHGNLTVTVDENPQVVQPAPFSRGETAVQLDSTIDARETGSPMTAFNGGASLAEIVRFVNAIGVGPSDLVAILEALKQAGALRAELVVI